MRKHEKLNSLYHRLHSAMGVNFVSYKEFSITELKKFHGKSVISGVSKYCNFACENIEFCVVKHYEPL